MCKQARLLSTTGLVIDDFFCLSTKDISHAAHASGGLKKATAAYQKEGALGIDDKEVTNSLHYKVIGAEINSPVSLAREGMVWLRSVLGLR